MMRAPQPNLKLIMEMGSISFKAQSQAHNEMSSISLKVQLRDPNLNN